MGNGRRAVDDAEKREILDRLYALWTTGPCRFLRLGQLIGNVYHSTDNGGVALYYEEDYPLLDELEGAYRRIHGDVPSVPELRKHPGWSDELTEEGIDVPVAVCTAHRRFVPCRHGSDASPCVHSGLADDVARVAQFQSGD